MAIINQNTRKLLEDRYYFKDKSTGEVLEKEPEEMFARVAKFVASAEKQEDIEKYTNIFYDMMNNQYFMPNTPTLIGSGYKNKCLSACSVIGDIPDNLDDIYKYMWKNATLTKYGSGVGQTLNKIRPKNEIIKSSGGSSAGAVNWMKLLNSVAETTIQGDKARRAANMVILRFNHPDIFDFIVSKQNDKSLSTMNISVSITNAEMEAVENDENIWLEWNNKKYKEVKARDIYNAIIDGMYLNGEPSFIWLDNINKKNPFNLQNGNFDNNDYHYITCTNPCLYKDSIMFYQNNLIKIKDNSSGLNSWETGIKDCIKIVTNAGHELILTKDHKVMLEDGSFINAENSVGLNLRWETKNKKCKINEKWQFIGFLFGDGCLSGNKTVVSVKLNKLKEQEIYNLLIKYGFKENKNSFDISKNKLEKSLQCSLDFLENKVNKRCIPDDIFFSDCDKLGSFISGLFEANGSVIKSSGQISLKSTCLDMIQKMQIALSVFGIKAWIVTNPKHMVSWKNGDYESKESYNLQVAPRNAKYFLENIGFLSDYKNKYIRNLDGKYKSKLKVVSIENIGEKEVWDFSNENHYDIVNGITVHNCGEAPLEANEFCNLGCINVSNIFNQETKSVDWKLFEYLIINSIRFLDNIIDVNYYALPEFEEKVKGNRKIGLGVTGYAELLIKLGIKYDSDEHLKFINELFGFKQEKELKASSDLAKERGNFPNWNESIYKINKKQMRNATVSTQMPTGSVSSILNTTSYGIEPLFNVAYLRRIVTGEIYEANELFAKMLHDIIDDEKKEQKIIKDCFDKGTAQIQNVPEYLKKLFVCANDISPDWHIKVQAEIQKYIQLGLSKTINAPEKHKKEELFDLMIFAWKQGIMGTTYYRNNSREKQTIQIGNKNQLEPDIIMNSIVPRHRPQIGKTYGTTSRYENACGSFYLTINRDGDGNILETFVNTSKTGTCKSNIDALNRMISLSLRSGVKVEEIVDQLSGIICPACATAKGKNVKKIDGKSCPDIISKAILEEYKNITPLIIKPQSISTNIESKQQEEGLCPDCGTKLELAEGCRHCPNPECMWSKCN